MGMRPLIWKEFLELVRDYRTLAALGALPLIMLPLLGFMSTYLQSLEQGALLIVNRDSSTGSIGNITIESSDISEYISRSMVSKGYSVYIGETSSPIDAVLIIPQGFSKNLSSLVDRAYVEIQRIPGSPRADRLLSDLYSVLQELSTHVSNLKIGLLASRAEINANPESIRDPVVVLLTTYITPTGEEIGYEQALRIYVARLLAFSLIFVATPATTYVVDSILGEKERRTLEVLLMAPLRRRDLILAKAFSSSLVGLFAAAIEIIAVVIFLQILAHGALGTSVYDPQLVLLSAFVVYLTILSTLALSLPIIVRSATVRSAQIASSIITVIASSIFFSALFVDIDRLPTSVSIPMMILPYTHSVLAIRLFSLGDITGSMTHLLALAVFSIIMIIASSYLLNEEKILMKPV
ncbi:MAG: ABC transporter permease subunit [Sulfolobales archaeon]